MPKILGGVAKRGLQFTSPLGYEEAFLVEKERLIDFHIGV
jgi:hypothetical protein